MILPEGITISEEAGGFLEMVEQRQTDGMSAWRSNEVERREGSAVHGVGLIAVRDIDPQTVVAIKQGWVVNERTIRHFMDIIRGAHQQIGEDKFLTGLRREQVALNLAGYNHSCVPTSGIWLVEGLPVALVVSRTGIEAGQEVTVDYSVSFDSATQRIDDCNCGNVDDCRGIVDPSTDWTSPDFQKLYAGEFPAWMQNKIDHLVAADLAISN